MRKFSAKQLVKFLRLVDAELHRPCRIVLIGGGAVSLAYHGEHSTADLDLWSVSDQEFWDAVGRARARANVPVQKASIAEPPYDFEERLAKLDLEGLNRLEVLVPESHDLVLMKTARAEAHDLDAIEDIHREVTLSLDTLIERFHETKAQVTGSPGMFKVKFQAMIARLFGENVAREIEDKL